jgi:plasmid replication initiation protein
MPVETKAKHALASYEASDPERQNGERWVTMSNALTRAGHGLTLAEKRIVACAASKLDSRAAPKGGEVLRTKITAAEYAELAGCGMNAAYEALQDAAKNLFNRKITFFEAAHKRRGKAIKPIRNDMRWVGRCRYHEGEAWVELSWWPDLLPYLVGLKKQFTSYQLQQASALRSVYSWRLLELLTRFESTGWAEYNIEDFKVSMDAPPSLSDFAQVKRRIIEPAVKELTTKDGWLIQWKPIKKGRKVSTLRFDFKRQNQLPLELSV